MALHFEVALHIAQGIVYKGDPGEDSSSPYVTAMRQYAKALQLAPNSALANYYYGYGWPHLPLRSPMKAATAQRAKAALRRAAALDRSGVKKAAEEAPTRVP